MNTAIQSFEYLDIDRLAETVVDAGYDAEYVQLEKGRMAGNFRSISLVDVGVIRERINRSVEYWGALPQPMANFLFLESGPGFTLNGSSPGSTKAWFIPPGCELNSKPPVRTACRFCV